MSERMVGKITIGGVEFQTPVLDVPRDSAERDAMERHYSLGFRAGAEAGIRLYAHWKDGVQYVGTCGRTLEEALADLPTAPTPRR